MYGKKKTLLHTRIKDCLSLTKRHRLSVSQVARENGLHPTIVSRWKREFKKNPEEAFHEPRHHTRSKAKYAEMKRLVGNLYAENDFLK
jgi:transposase